MRIDGQVALVTGGASGLGAAAVRLLAARGATVVSADLVQDPESVPGDSTFVTLDVRDAAAVEAAVVFAGSLGQLRIVVNCAGIVANTPTLDPDGAPLELDRFAEVIQTNLVGTFNVIRCAAAAMASHDPLDGDRGVIVNTASIAAYDGVVGQAAYSASKGGVVAMTLPIARDLATRAIRVVTLAPGLFDTPILSAANDLRRAKLLEQVQHPRRLGQPDEFAALVAHVVENPMLNGETIRLDAGLRVGPYEA